MRLLFANIGWMEHYEGNCDTDMIVGGGSYDNKDKHEAFNFQDLNGKCYGFVQTVRNSKIKLLRIDKDIADTEEKITDVLVVWVASYPNVNGSYIVGWYKNATVYADYQPSKHSARNKYNYNIMANKKDCYLLPFDSRTMNVPRATTNGKGYLGQSNVWYADYEIKEIQDFRKEVTDYIYHFKAKKKFVSKSLVKIDSEARKQVEEEAIKFVTNQYQERGYKITSREKENIGWDLDAINGNIHLKLEVKGLASNTISVHITSNEYEKMMKDKQNYRLCIVINAIKKPQMIVFIWDSSLNQWVSEDDPTIILSVDIKPSYIACVK